MTSDPNNINPVEAPTLPVQEPASRSVTEIAYLGPMDKFIGRNPKTGRWDITVLKVKEAAVATLLNRGWDLSQTRKILSERRYLRFDRIACCVGKPEVFQDPSGELILNLWVKPTLVPHPGEFPTVDRIMDWHTAFDPEAKRWFYNWLARKAQNPAIVPGVAVVLISGMGTGKGTLCRAISEVMGPDNCLEVGEEDLESKFNAEMAGKLFVFANEVSTAETRKDISRKLLVWIDSQTVKLESKGRDKYRVDSYLAWLFMSNEAVPVVLKDGDRRYSVFTNHDPVPPEWRALVRGCFEPTNPKKMTESFQAEVAAFAHHLLTLEVDHNAALTPYDNQARNSLIAANRAAHQDFFAEVNEHGIDVLLEEMLEKGDFELRNSRKEWDFSDEGVRCDVVYKTYQFFATKTGRYALGLNRFGIEAAAARPEWPRIRGKVTESRNGAKQRPWMYRVRRSDKALKVVPKPADVTTKVANP